MFFEARKDLVWLGLWVKKRGVEKAAQELAHGAETDFHSSRSSREKVNVPLTE